MAAAQRKAHQFFADPDLNRQVYKQSQARDGYEKKKNKEKRVSFASSPKPHAPKKRDINYLSSSSDEEPEPAKKLSKKGKEKTVPEGKGKRKAKMSSDSSDSEIEVVNGYIRKKAKTKKKEAKLGSVRKFGRRTIRPPSSDDDDGIEERRKKAKMSAEKRTIIGGSRNFYSLPSKVPRPSDTKKKGGKSKSEGDGAIETTGTKGKGKKTVESDSEETDQLASSSSSSLCSSDLAPIKLQQANGKSRKKGKEAEKSKVRASQILALAH